MKKEKISNTSATSKSPQKKAKKTLLVIILSIVGAMIILGIASVIIDLTTKNKEEEIEIDYDFYPANYEENIYEDEKYLSLIEGEFIKYKDSTSNVTIGINQDNVKQQGKEVQFIVDMLYDIINGDHKAYNNRFSDVYYEYRSPKAPFTMQKIYDVIITYISAETVADQDGNYTKSLYCIEYKIYENNGTFRRDIGVGSRKQYFTLNTSDNGTILIDSVSTVKTSK